MEVQTIAALYAREIRALRREIDAYPDDESLWACPDGVKNAGGTLAQHLVGNLRHFIGGRLGGSSYVRDRDAEFRPSGMGKADLLALVDAATDEVAAGFRSMDAAALDADFPDVVMGHHVGNREILLHLLSHLGYHLGQIDYHRRLVSGSDATVEAIAVKEIPGLRPA